MTVNMRFTIDWCIYGYPNNPNQTLVMTSCYEACVGPNSELESASTNQILSTNSSTQYQYCDVNSGAFPRNVGACIDCVQNVPNSTTLVNCEYFAIAVLTKLYLILLSRSPRAERGLPAETQTWRQYDHRAKLRLVPLSCRCQHFYIYQRIHNPYDDYIYIKYSSVGQHNHFFKHSTFSIGSSNGRRARNRLRGRFRLCRNHHLCPQYTALLP